jgi:hypothetical protein
VGVAGARARERLMAGHAVLSFAADMGVSDAAALTGNGGAHEPTLPFRDRRRGTEQLPTVVGRQHPPRRRQRDA